jgi:hypothetical protein
MIQYHWKDYQRGHSDTRSTLDKQWSTSLTFWTHTSSNLLNTPEEHHALAFFCGKWTFKAGRFLEFSSAKKNVPNRQKRPGGAVIPRESKISLARKQSFEQS